MWLSILLAAGFVVILWKLCFPARSNLDHIPGSNENMIWSIITSKAPDPATFHLYLARQAKKYGPVMKIPQINSDPFVFLNDFDSIYQVLVKYGRETGGRPKKMFRLQSVFQGTGLFGHIKPDANWKILRKITHHHLKQFGDGLSPLEININFVAEKMFEEFEKNCIISYDPIKAISDAAAESIIYLATGQCLPSDHPVVVKMKEYEAKLLDYTSPYAPIGVLILDFFPWLRHFGWPGYKLLLRLLELEQDVWKMLVSLNEGTTKSESITTSLRANVTSGDNSVSTADQITDLDARKATFVLLFAGSTTTKSTFYGTINLLAHYRGIQEKLFLEIKHLVGNQNVSLVDRPNMPYTRATILEILRYTSVAVLGVPHQALSDVTIKGHRIPKDTLMMINYWSLHWDPDFWGDPEVFRPERFLDEAGEVVAVDHPRRKHLMPFGAGTRVCVGETLGLSRLFLWITTFIQRFEVKPGDGNNKSKLDAENLAYNGTLQCAPYNIILEKRS